MSWEAAASVAGPLVGGLMGQGAASSANRTNLKIAQRQEQFQREMSNTAHQRQVADMRAAGLNPLLSAGGSGSSTPSGASTRVDPVNQIAEGLNRSVSNAMEARRLHQELKTADAQIKLTNASAATQATQASLNTSNALAAKQNAQRVAMETKALEAKYPALAKRAEADLKHATIDSKYADADAILDRTSKITGAAGNLMGLGKFFNLFGTPSKPKSSGYTREHYDAQGEHIGTQVYRNH